MGDNLRKLNYNISNLQHKQYIKASFSWHCTICYNDQQINYYLIIHICPIKLKETSIILLKINYGALVVHFVYRWFTKTDMVSVDEEHYHYKGDY